MARLEKEWSKMQRYTKKQRAAISVFLSVNRDVDNDWLIPRLIAAGAANTIKGAHAVICRFTRGYQKAIGEIFLDRYHIGKRVYFRRA